MTTLAGRRTVAPPWASSDAEAFVQEHRGCGQLEGDAGEPGPYGYAVWLACSCRARLTRWVTPELAERDLRVIDAE